MVLPQHFKSFTLPEQTFIFTIQLANIGKRLLINRFGIMLIYHTNIVLKLNPFFKGLKTFLNIFFYQIGIDFVNKKMSH